MSISLTFDSHFLFSSQTDSFGITSQTVQQTQMNVTEAITKVETNIAEKKYGFIEEISHTEYISEAKNVFEQIRWAKTLVVIGIGGSDLGARAVQQALESEEPPTEVIFHGDSTDPIAIRRLLRRITLEETVFNIISKSGQTVETTAQYLFFKTLLKKTVPEWQKHFVFTTDPEDGILRQEANTFSILTVPIPSTVGGRFSVLTPVGLLPALAMGVPIDEMLQGALDFAADERARKISQELAKTQFQLFQEGTKIVVMMPYSIQLEEFSRWFRQLWAESLGKHNTGILPIQARGPADQHSQGQFYNEGSRLQSLLILQIDHRTTNYELHEIDIEEMKYLEGHSFHEIINIEAVASSFSLKKNGRPSATLHLSEVTPYTFGQLFLFFELAVVYLAEMFGVNAFDQPGVEEGKNMMYAFLGRKGFEEKKKEIEELLKAS